MRYRKTYTNTQFHVTVVQSALEEFQNIVERTDGEKNPYSLTYNVKIGDEEWDYDNIEEFYAALNHSDTYRIHCTYTVSNEESDTPSWYEIAVIKSTMYTIVEVRADRRDELAQILNVFDNCPDSSKSYLNHDHDRFGEACTVFIGHGHSSQWRDLRDHLQDKHRIRVQAYETATRAGHAIRDVLEDLMDMSSFAILVLTCDDEMGCSKYRARQNVIHETGLFQGRLGFLNAILLVEEGIENFSNMDGINQIRFSRGNIKETFGEVVAIVRERINTGVN